MSIAVPVLRVGQLDIRPDEFVAFCDGRRLNLTGRGDLSPALDSELATARAGVA